MLPELAAGTAALRAGGDIKRGFIYKRIPHVTLKSIANNEEIDSIHAEFAPKIEKALATLNKAAKKDWKEWEVPREFSDHARPHPGTLPREEGETHSALGMGETHEKSEERAAAVPSLGGEGQGEGGRSL